LSKDYLDRTLDRDPDRGPDQVADRTLNRDPAKKTDRESEGKDDRTVKLRPGSGGKLTGDKRGKPVATPAKKPVAAAGKKPAATAGAKPVASPAKKPVATAGAKPVASPAKKLVRDKGQKPVAGPSKKPVAVAGDRSAARPSSTNAADATVVLNTRSAPVEAIVADMDLPASPDETVEMRAEPRLEVIIPIEMQIMIEVPGAGKISGASENVSCRGMLARLNGPIEPDTRCQVHFLGSEDVTPSHVFGRVIRIAKSRFGYSVAFRFERPVQLKVAPPPPRNRT